MSSYYTDIFKVLEKFKVERDNRELFLEKIPEFRGSLYRKIIFPELDKFLPMKFSDGSIALTPGDQNMWIYRGQNKDFSNCLPSIYRNNPDEFDWFDARLRSCEFELLIKNHPVVIELLEEGYLISYMGLARHYGLKTEFLDVTSDPYVAAFFAVCSFNKTKDKFEPIYNQNYPGVLMKSLRIIYQNSRNTHKQSKLVPIGLQPFPRPGNQKALALQLGQYDEFVAHKMIFNHTKKGSDYLFDLFEGGKILFPTDPLKNKVDEIAQGTSFSEKALEKLISKFSSTKNPQYYIEKLGYTITKSSPYSFSESELSKFKLEWDKHGRKEFKNQIGQSSIVF